MSPITKIALRRIKKNGKRSLLLSVAVFFSMLMITFFVFFLLQTQKLSAADCCGLPIKECMSIATAALTVITFITVRTYCSMQNDEVKIPHTCVYGIFWAYRIKINSRFIVIHKHNRLIRHQGISFSLPYQRPA